MESEKKSTFLNHFLVLGTGTLVYLLVGIVGTPIITRLVDPADYGRMSLLTVYSSIGMMLCGLGLDQALVRYFYRDETLARQRTLLHTCCTISLTAASLVGMGLLIFSQPIQQELLLLVIHVPVLLLHRFVMLILRLRYRTKLYSAVNILQKSAYILLTVTLVLLVRADHFLLLAIAGIGSTLIALAVGMLRERDIWALPVRETAPSVPVGELLRYGLPLMLSSGISVLFNALDKLFISHFCTLADVGVYAGAMNLMAVFSVVRTSFSALWMPSAVEHYEKNPQDRQFYRRANAFISIIMLSFGAVIVLCKDLFALLLGSQYQDAARILPFLMFEPIMYTISETTATGIVIQKRSSYQVIVAGGACLVNFLGNWLLTPLMGPQGAALSTGISYIVFFALRTGLSQRVFHVDYSLSRFALATLALALFAYYGSSHSFSWVQFPMFLAVLAVITLAYRKDLKYAFDYARRAVSKH